jgi:hypothetical protein
MAASAANQVEKAIQLREVLPLAGRQLHQQWTPPPSAEAVHYLETATQVVFAPNQLLEVSDAAPHLDGKSQPRRRAGPGSRLRLRAFLRAQQPRHQHLQDVLLTGNLIFRLNDSGLRANVIPLIGLSYVL